MAKPTLPPTPEWKFPVHLESEYESALVAFNDQMEAIINEVVIPELPLLVAERDRETPAAANRGDSVEFRADDWAPDAERVINQMNIRFATMNFSPELIAADIGQKTSAWNDLEWRRIMNAVLGVELNYMEPWLKTQLQAFSVENARLIKSVAADVQNQVAERVNRGLMQGDRANSIAYDLIGDSEVFKALEKREGEFLARGIKNVKGKSVVTKSKNRLKLIARDQIGKLNGQLTRLRQTNIGLDEYIWRDSEDNRVRPTHKANNGKKFKWEKPPPKTGNPGEDILCRCWAEPVWGPILDDIGLGEFIQEGA